MNTVLEKTMIRPADELGPVLAGRSLAEALRNRIEELASREHVVVDFEGVEAVSPSFADEIFAKLPPELVESGRVRFEHIDAALENLIEFVTATRAQTS